MFHIDKNKIIVSSLPIIVDGYNDLLFDDEPILYTGFNKDGNIIIGSSVDEDYEKKIERHFHSQVSKEIYFNFLKQEISYRRLLEEVQSFFVIDSSFDGKTTTIYLVNIKDIPEDYLPTYEAYCPEEVYKPAYEYGLILTGKKANEHIADITEATNLQDNFAKLARLKIKNFPFSTIAYLLPSNKAASFDFNFKIEIKEGEQLDILFDEKEFMSFFYQYLDFCSNYLLKEKEVFIGDEGDFPKFNSLRKVFLDLYKKLNISIEDEIENILKEEIKKSASTLESMTENIGKNFTTIQFSNKVDGRINTICIFDEKYRDIIEETNVTIEKYSPEYYSDKEVNSYRIQIYNLNTETRKGSAYVESGDYRLKVKFSILGDEPIEESKYTQSLDKGKVIDIKGKAKKVKEEIKRLEIEFEKE
ncbi:hypothetical protein AMJ80_11660 [bacterium SM23_31]|nr:MAG: hypothetical protein AMJ80_11660 [bacterium SM23_31]